MWTNVHELNTWEVDQLQMYTVVHHRESSQLVDKCKQCKTEHCKNKTLKQVTSVGEQMCTVCDTTHLFSIRAVGLCLDEFNGHVHPMLKHIWT